MVSSPLMSPLVETMCRTFVLLIRRRGRSARWRISTEIGYSSPTSPLSSRYRVVAGGAIA
jgi:hypothetical protein